MNIYCDLHLHSSFSSDSESAMEQMVLAAIAKNLRCICFTEHLDPDYPENPEGLTFLVDLPAFHAEYLRLQEKYCTDIEILYGIELGIQPHLSAQLGALTRREPFDFVIASQHLLDGQDPYERCFWTGRSETETYRTYFQELYANLSQMTDFDTAAHLDYIVRYGPDQNRFYSYAAYADVIDPILQLIIEKDKCLEVNTAGLKYGLGQTNPAADVLQRYYDLGGRHITLGSDAHAPEHIAWQFDQAETMLRQIGFHSLCIFRRRERFEVPL